MQTERLKLMAPLWPEHTTETPSVDSKGKVWYLLLAGMVQRYHTVPTISTDTVGEHSFGVAWLCTLMSEGKPRAELLLAALWHDVTELSNGDVPAPAKRRLGIRQQMHDSDQALMRDMLNIPEPQLTVEERQTLAVADCVDGMLHCCYERALGNRLIEEVYCRFLSYVDKFALSEGENKIVLEVIHLWSIYNDC